MLSVRQKVMGGSCFASHAEINSVLPINPIPEKALGLKMIPTEKALGQAFTKLGGVVCLVICIILLMPQLSLDFLHLKNFTSYWVQGPQNTLWTVLIPLGIMSRGMSAGQLLPNKAKTGCRGGIG